MKKLEWHTEQRIINDLIPYEQNPRTIAYFGNIRTLFPVTSGQHSGISGHLVESLNKRYSLIINNRYCVKSQPANSPLDTIFYCKFI